MTSICAKRSEANPAEIVDVVLETQPSGFRSLFCLSVSMQVSNFSGNLQFQNCRARINQVPSSHLMLSKCRSSRVVAKQPLSLVKGRKVEHSFRCEPLFVQKGENGLPIPSGHELRPSESRRKPDRFAPPPGKEPSKSKAKPNVTYQDAVVQALSIQSPMSEKELGAQVLAIRRATCNSQHLKSALAKLVDAERVHFEGDKYSLDRRGTTIRKRERGKTKQDDEVVACLFWSSFSVIFPLRQLQPL